jgi:hypothetical protein
MRLAGLFASCQTHPGSALGRLRLALVALLVLPVVVAGRAEAQPGLLIGVHEQQFRWTHNRAPLQSAVRDLGLQAVRIMQVWMTEETKISDQDLAELKHAVGSVKDTEARIVLSVFGGAKNAPQDDEARSRYCGYVRSILVKVPQIVDLVIWNEVNSSMFWKPQYNPNGSAVAPAAYEALLEACYGTLHTARPGLNMITSLAPRGNDDPRFTNAITNVPASFVRGLGAAYRAGGRQVKIFDTFGQNVYGLTSAERPWRAHARSGLVSQGDYPRLIEALNDAFQGTRQPLPGQGGVTIWYLEHGFQTEVFQSKAAWYEGKENASNLILSLSLTTDPARPADTSPAPDQATQLTDALFLAYCQPGVGAFFNFMLADETSLAGWQSGLLWADWTRKPSFPAFEAAIAQVRAGTVDCTKLKGGTAGGTAALLAPARKATG